MMLDIREGNFGGDADFKAPTEEKPDGEYVEGEGLNLNFTKDPEWNKKDEAPAKKYSYEVIEIPEGADLSFEQKSSINSINWSLLNFDSNVKTLEYEMNVRHEMVGALGRYRSHLKNVQSITDNIQNLPTEIAMSVIDKAAPAMNKVDTMVPQFEEEAKNQALKVAGYYEKYKTSDPLFWAHKITEIKNVCKETGISVSSWEHDPNIEKVLNEFPEKKQYDGLLQKAIDYYHKVADTTDEPAEKLENLKYIAAGAAVRTAKKNEALGFPVEESLQSQLQPLAEFYEANRNK